MNFQKFIKKVDDEHKKVLILGEAVYDFKKVYDNPIKEVRNSEDVRRIVGYYFGIKNLEIPLVISISFLNEEASFLLLKLVEESQFTIILLSRYDNISSILLSRIEEVVKYEKGKIKSEFLSIKIGKEIIEEKLDDDSSYYNRLKYIIEYSPQMLFMESRISEVKRNRDKIRDILYEEY